MTGPRPPVPPPATAELSVLIDRGSAWTKASVVAQSRGRWRIVAHAAQPTSWGDEELLDALARRLEPTADRRVAGRLRGLLADAPRINSHTPARPGRVAIASLTDDLSGAAARAAAEGAGWVVEASVALDDGRGVAERMATLQRAEVDAWLLTGGFDDARNDRTFELAGMVRAARAASSTPVIWAGSRVMAAEMVSIFEPGACTAVANPLPAPESERGVGLRGYLEALLEATLEPGGVRALTPFGFRRAIAELGRTQRLRILGVDLGARYASWVLTDADGSAEGWVQAAGGIATSAHGSGTAAGRIVRWLPSAADELAVRDTLETFRARPATLPHTDDELAVLHAAARAMLAAHRPAVPPGGIDLLVGAGRTIAAAPTPAQAMQLLVDGVRPSGTFQVAIDPAGVLGPLGALGNPEISEGLAELRDDLLTPLGAAVVCRGGRAGQPAMRVVVRRAGWPALPAIELRAGQVQVVELGPGQVADVEIELDAEVAIGAPGGARRVSATLTGGSVGLVLDARSTPPLLPRRSDDRRAVLGSWRDAFAREAAPRTAGPQAAAR